MVREEEVEAENVETGAAEVEAKVVPVEAEAPAPAVAEQVPVPVVAYVVITNPKLDKATHVQLTGGLVRLGPKETLTCPVDYVTDEARRVEAEGRINIRNL